jgi:hypothetical protein
MSAFDSLKYPLSDEPTEEEIDALPKAIAAWWIITNPYQAVRLILHIKHPQHFKFDEKKMVRSLRKAIFTYGEGPIQKLKRWCSHR